MKKRMALLMAAVTAISAMGIGTTVYAKEETEQVLDGKTVGFAQTDSMSAWRTTETDSIKEYVEKAGGELIVKDAGGDIATQESDIRDLVAAGVDYLVVAPLEDNGLQGALEEAMANEIRVPMRRLY